MVQRFTPQIYRLAFRMLGSRAEAEDACQEAFVRMHRSIDSFDATRTLAPWVSRIAYHVCLRRLERVAAQPRAGAAEDELEVLPASGRDPERQAAASEEDALVEGFLGELAAQDRALLLLRYRDGLSDSEVAEATGMSVGTVKTRIFRARARLREQLAPLTGDES
ncbi:MAG: sigma-70 family RNA polymerase sigma factor [Myxococcales bacterium]|nr:sigma-70 family RNA polymerase sigma factor [Myxococcales bacterium]